MMGQVVGGEVTMDAVDLRGMIDLHIHTAPDVRARYGDDIQVVREAAEAGMGGLLLKSHWTLTADRAAIAEKVVGGIRVYGGLALNSTVGWLNPRAVEVGLQMGAAQIWMPTLDLAGPPNYRRDKPIVHDAEGKVRPEIFEIIDLVRDAGAILGTGHLTIAETLTLVRVARERRLEKILVTHPEASFIAMPDEVLEALMEQGVYFELCYGDVGSPGSLTPDIGRFARLIHRLGVAQVVLSTDYGQAGRPSPVQGLRNAVAGLLQAGLSEAAVRRIVAENPKALLDGAPHGHC